MTAKLSININKVATLRNARGKNSPDLVRTAMDLITLGAEGITVHPRPDERHVRRSDVYALKPVVNVEYNIEGFPSEDFLEMMGEVLPDQVTLVPDPPEAITSNAGWRLQGHEKTLEKALGELSRLGRRVSLFVDPFAVTKEELKTFRSLGAQRIELYTEKFADDFVTGSYQDTLAVYRQCADHASELGMGVNAGHDLNSANLKALALGIPQLAEVSIGHAFISEALYLGFEQTLKVYKAQLRDQ